MLRRLTALTAVLAFLVAGCGDTSDSGSGSGESPEASASASAESSTEDGSAGSGDGDASGETDAGTGDVEERPGYAGEEGTAGAQQFATYWVETLNEATTSGETAQLRSLAAPECQTCDDFAEQLEEIYGAGGRVEAEGWEIASMTPEAGSSEDTTGLLLQVDVPAQQVYASEDAKVQEFEGGKQGLRMQLVWDDDQWFVANLSPR